MSSIKGRIFTSTEKYIYHPTIPFCSVSDIPTLLGNMRGSQENDGGRNSCTPFSRTYGREYFNKLSKKIKIFPHTSRPYSADLTLQSFLLLQIFVPPDVAAKQSLPFTKSGCSFVPVVPPASGRFQQVLALQLVWVQNVSHSFCRKADKKAQALMSYLMKICAIVIYQ